MRSAHGYSEDLRKQVAAAQREREAAQQFFQMVCDPDLVDEAIYLMEAAERKYASLYRRLRQSYGLPTGEED